jgi:TRAP-type C4-dicarboxylate transport system permease small subunit
VEAVDRYLKAVSRWLETALSGVMAALVGLAFIQVVLRYLFDTSLFWADEVILFLFTWLIFLAAAVNLERGSHFGVDVLVKLLPRPAQILIQALVQIGIALILGVFAWYGFRFAAGAWIQESDILRVPKTVVYISLPLAACLMLLVVGRNLGRLWRGQTLQAQAEEL